MALKPSLNSHVSDPIGDQASRAERTENGCCSPSAPCAGDAHAVDDRPGPVEDGVLRLAAGADEGHDHVPGGVVADGGARAELVAHDDGRLQGSVRQGATRQERPRAEGVRVGPDIDGAPVGERRHRVVTMLEDVEVRVERGGRPPLAVGAAPRPHDDDALDA